jgi:hypothetical protein
MAIEKATHAMGELKGKEEVRPTYTGHVVSYRVTEFNGQKYPKIEIFNKFLGSAVYALHEEPSFPYEDGDKVTFYPKNERAKQYCFILDS